MPDCSIHQSVNEFSRVTKVPAVAKIKRVFDDKKFNIMFACDHCLSEVRRMSARYDFKIEVEMFNRRQTDELKRNGVIG